MLGLHIVENLAEFEQIQHKVINLLIFLNVHGGLPVLVQSANFDNLVNWRSDFFVKAICELKYGFLVNLNLLIEDLIVVFHLCFKFFI